ncbi:ArsR family transcriptional regulator [Actinoplanes sp. CA-015351]|uniref:ArsR family transcriptional regulator n=1 Tax=Actinoplanes sp. CA-015351 TaxID=3239897 RepID=UPI003D98C252
MAGQGVRQVSSAIFGNKYRLELLLALASAADEGICVKDLADACDAPTSVFQPQLRALMSAGLVRRLPQLGQNRRVFYALTDMSTWTGLRRLVQDLQPDELRTGVREGANR